MSWFSDIAGRAEDLLNKVDKSAASALQKGKENDGLQRSSSALGGSMYSPPVSQSSSLLPQNPAGPVPGPSGQQWVSRSGQLAPSPAKSSKAKKQEEEDKLLAFLNSPEPLAGSSSGQPTPQVSTTKFEEVKTVSSNVSDQQPLSEEKSQSTVIAADPQVLPSNVTGGHTDSPNVVSFEMEVPEETTTASEPDLEVSSVQATAGPPVASPSAPSSQTWSIAQEAEHLRLEAKEGRQVLQDLQRALQEEQGEKRRLQKKLEHWTTQVSESDGLLRELQSREADLKNILSAKDSQLAVLKVRLQEADQRLDSCQAVLKDTQTQLEEQVKLNSLQQQSLDSLRSKLAETETMLRQEKQEHSRNQRENQELLSQKEEELHGLTDNLVTSQKSVQQLRGQNRDLVQQLGLSRRSLEAAQQELSQYRLKAQRVLHSKEKLIVALKECRPSGEESLEESFQMVDPPGIMDPEGDREALREELAQAQTLGQALRQELAALEQTQALEAQTHEDELQAVKERLRTEEQKRREAQLELQQNTEELHYLREDMSRSKSSQQARIKDREAEIEKLRKQVTAKSLSQGNNLSSNQQRELESRLKNLTESLIQKQTLVEALSTEKNALAMQMEVMERKLKDVLGSNSKGPTHIVGITTEGTRERLPSVFVESPYDGSVARKVKRAYSALDAFSIRMGSFLRRYPSSRAFLFLYMALLHVWVMVVLCTYQPEIHPTVIQKNRTL